MGLAKNIRIALAYKEMKTVDLANALGLERPQVSVALSRDAFGSRLAQEYADALDCDIVLRDRKTGEIY